MKSKLGTSAFIREITFEDHELRDAETYFVRLANKYKHGVANHPNQPFNGVIVSDKAMKGVIAAASQSVNEAERPLFEKTKAKWMVDQGGSQSFEQLIANLPLYYNVHHSFGYARDAIKRYVKSLAITWFKQSGLVPAHLDAIITNSRQLFNTYEGKHSSNGSFSYDGDRRDREARIVSITDAKANPYNFQKVGGEMRYKDGKFRNVFNDPFSNYFRETMFLYKMFKVWENTYMDMHYSDKELSQIISEFNASDSYAGDYTHMDMDYTHDTFDDMLDIAGNAFGVPYEQINHIKYALEDLFATPLVVGDHIVYGEHNYFSGIYPTHHGEGIMNFSILTAPCHTMGFTVVTSVRKLRKNEAAVIVCGDDSIVLFGRRLTNQERIRFGRLHELYSKAFNFNLELSKVEWSDSFVTVCKKTFALNNRVKGFKHATDENGKQYPIWKYSCLKAAWALRHPENIPSFPEKKDLIIWFCSIMDNAWGTTQWKGTVLAIVQQNPQLFGDLPTEISKEMEVELNKDWWFRNYAKFELPKSPTFQLLQSLLK